MAGSETWTHVYVARFPDFTKIGATKNVTNRILDLRSAYGIRDVKLVKSWKVGDAYKVEWLAKRLLWHHEKLGYERFVIDPDIAIAAVEEAISLVNGGLCPRTSLDRRRSRKEWHVRRASEYAAMREAFREYNEQHS